jgi:hypothetical protein
MRNPTTEFLKAIKWGKALRPGCLAVLCLLASVDILPAKDFEAVLRKVMTRPGFQNAGDQSMDDLAKEIRKEYGNNEAAIIADALRFGEGQQLEEADYTILMVFSALDLSPASRLSLIGKVMIGTTDWEKGKCYMLLKFSDLDPKEGRADVDLSRHSKLIGDGTDLPAEYLFYLFKQDGTQAWKLLGGSAEKSPALSDLEKIDMSAGPMAARRKWTNEIRPGLEGKNFPSTKRDACYLARYLGSIYGSEETARQNNPEIMKQLDQVIPGLGVALVEMGESMENVPKTPPAEAAAWVQRTRAKLK